MNVFIVYAHPESKSFNGAMKDLAVSELTSLGHKVKVSDLYAMNFKAVSDQEDFLILENENFCKYQVEQAHASKTQGFCFEIQQEQEKLKWADFVILQFPIWWYSVPAIMKGWFDRVFASGFVYGKEIDRYDTGGLKGRKVMISTSMGSPKEAYTPARADGDVMDILYPINHGTLYFSGLQPVEPYVAWQPAHDEDDRKRYLEEYRQRLHHLSEIPIIPYHPRSHYDEHHQLKKEYRKN